MKRNLINLLVALAVISCQDDNDKKGSNMSPIAFALASVPDSYSFQNKETGQSSVSYKGQVFRQLLILELKNYIKTQTKGGYRGSADQAFQALDSFVNYSYDNDTTSPGSINGYSLLSLSIKAENGQLLSVTEGPTLGSIQEEGKQLLNKLAGNDYPLEEGLLGWNTPKFHGIDLKNAEDDTLTPEALLYGWLKVIAQQSVANETEFAAKNGDLPAQMVTEAFVTKEGWDLNQLIEKFLHGAVSFSQASGDYLSYELGESKGLNADNNDLAKAGENYTALSHHFDEAFGYFGGARDYKIYTDDQIAGLIHIDSDKDGSISLLREKNFGISINAAKRDLGSAHVFDFRKSIIDSFLKGRHLIVQKPEGYLDEVKKYAATIIATWEKVLAANVIHYINETIVDIQSYNTIDYQFKNLAKHWSEMKGFALAFQFNPKSTLSKNQFLELHSLLGDSPSLTDTVVDPQYIGRLNLAKEMLQTQFEFTSLQADQF